METSGEYFLDCLPRYLHSHRRYWFFYHPQLFVFVYRIFLYCNFWYGAAIIMVCQTAINKELTISWMDRKISTLLANWGSFAECPRAYFIRLIDRRRSL